MKNAIYPGTFDPITNGHVDIIRRAVKLFDNIIVAISAHHGKGPLFSIKEREAMAREALKGIKGVSVEPFDGLLIEFAKSRKCNFIIKGLRAVSDFESELQQALTNRELDKGIETVFMMTSQEHIFLSSSLIREIASYNGPLNKFVPKNVEKMLRERYRKS
ncbi:MAG TPA: pantetheine-phosphate adenylyltransferase [Candidatus Nanoarchaeia archaeon]|nr:pantetheine-phosphate adenylyltransferase [Candidatus Nanoarchaeia archaeon]